MSKIISLPSGLSHFNRPYGTSLFSAKEPGANAGNFSSCFLFFQMLTFMEAQSFYLEQGFQTAKRLEQYRKDLAAQVSARRSPGRVPGSKEAAGRKEMGGQERDNVLLPLS